MSWTCQDYFKSQMIIFSVYCIIDSIQVLLCVISLYQIMKLDQQTKLPKALFVSQWIFYISSFIFGIARVINTILYCFAKQYEIFTYFLLATMWEIHWFALLSILYFRLKLVFDKTVYKLSKCSKYFIWIVSILVFCIAIVMIVFFILDAESVFIGVAIGLLVIIGLVMALFLTLKFVNNLQKLHKETMPQTAKENAELLDTVKKYVQLSIISILFSTLFAFNLIIVALAGFEWTYSISQSLAIIVCLDVFIDTICMTLSLQVNDKYYRLLFCIIDMESIQTNHMLQQQQNSILT